MTAADPVGADLAALGDLIGYDDRLRMVPVDAAALTAVVDRLLAAADAARAAGDHRGELRARRNAGVGLVALGRHEPARATLVRALDLADAAGRPFVSVAARINLADAHRYAGDPATADALYREGLAIARADAPDAIPFALQHLGKHLTERGDTSGAVAALTEALALRRAGDAPELAAATEEALLRATSAP